MDFIKKFFNKNHQMNSTTNIKNNKAVMANHVANNGIVKNMVKNNGMVKNMVKNNGMVKNMVKNNGMVKNNTMKNKLMGGVANVRYNIPYNMRQPTEKIMEWATTAGIPKAMSGGKRNKRKSNKTYRKRRN
jgi:hypothetical protein